MKRKQQNLARPPGKARPKGKPRAKGQSRPSRSGKSGWASWRQKKAVKQETTGVQTDSPPRVAQTIGTQTESAAVEHQSPGTSLGASAGRPCVAASGAPLVSKDRGCLRDSLHTALLRNSAGLCESRSEGHRLRVLATAVDLLEKVDDKLFSRLESINIFCCALVDVAIGLAGVPDIEEVALAGTRQHYRVNLQLGRHKELLRLYKCVIAQSAYGNMPLPFQ